MLTYFNEIKTEQYLHNLRVIRWTLQDIINGYINHRDKMFYLYDTIAHDAITKLDVISWIDNRFQSIEIFYQFEYKIGNKNKLFYNIGNYTDNLIKDIKKFSTKEYYNPLKMLKRIWSLSLVIECKELIKSLLPLFKMI
jgi:hypothetical protein